MTFAELAGFFERLEQTGSRLALIDILSELFKELEPSEIPQVSYLIQGRVAPSYQPVEIGMAEKSVAASIARAFHSDKDEVLRLYGEAGDLGKVAETLSQKSKVKSQKLSIKEVFNSLSKIAAFQGQGTVENKTSSLSGLLSSLGGVEAKHLVRIPLGVSRLGIGDPTVLDAFAKAKLGDKTSRKVLEEAYNRVSDLGLIGQTLFKSGLAGVARLQAKPGRPIRSELCERLPDAKTVLEKFEGRAHVQYKYDGFRVQIHKDGDEVRLFSRNLEETTDMFPEIVMGVKRQVKAQSAIFDSEALAVNPQSDEFLPFQETTRRRRKYGVAEMAEKLPLKAFVFDLMYLDGQPLMEMPLTTRVGKLQQAVEGSEVLIPQPGEIVDSAERIEELFNDALTKGLEGLVVKRVDSKYEAGARNFNWVKLKRHSAGELKDTIDCVILGYIYGRGKRAEFGAGALLAGVYNDRSDQFETVCKIGTGLSDEEWRRIHDRADRIRVESKPARVNAVLVPSVWIKPEIVIEVLADEITRSPVHTAGKEGDEPGYALRFPRLVRFRGEDKRAEDATTVRELVRMYTQQSKR